MNDVELRDHVRSVRPALNVYDAGDLQDPNETAIVVFNLESYTPDETFGRSGGGDIAVFADVFAEHYDQARGIAKDLLNIIRDETDNDVLSATYSDGGDDAALPHQWSIETVSKTNVNPL